MVPETLGLPLPPDLSLPFAVGQVQRRVLLDGVGKGTHFDLDLGSGGRGTVAEACGADVAPAHL